MAQTARISALTDELIHSIVGFDPATNRQAYKHAKEIASRQLRGHQYARTNQFDVVSMFNGLDEKFRVKNRDDLADALKRRLQKLESLTGKFKPDILSLLLLLSDRPLENTRVEALDLLRPPSPPLPLTWGQILEEDPYSDEDIWKDIDYAVESSGDERTTKEKLPPTKSSPPTSVDEDESYDPTACIVPAEDSLVKSLEVAQFWKHPSGKDSEKTEITELQMIRETLFMLTGLPTSLYRLDPKHNTIFINAQFVLAHVMPATLQHLLSELVDIGKLVYWLRQWTKRSSTLLLIQSLESAVIARLLDFDRALADMQRQHLTPNSSQTVSLLRLHTDVRSMSVPLLRLAQIVSDVEAELLLNPFKHLEALFEQVNLAQLMLEFEVFQYLASVFFDCLKTYLRPIRKWMESGELGTNDETFFVFESDSGSSAASIWHDRFVLRRDAAYNLQCPSFLQPAAKKIFNTGKSIVFLREMGIRHVGAHPQHKEPSLDYDAVCGLSDDIPVPPFSGLFQTAFNHWMESMYSQASSVLRQHLIGTSGLVRTMAHLETLYLGKNGAVFEDFANAVFERMDAGRKGWNDRYVLTEIAKNIFSTVMPPKDAERVVARSFQIKTDNHSVADLAAVLLDFALSWPIQNIIQRPSIPVYQQIFTLLLQTYRVKYLLQRTRLTRSTKLDSALTRLTCKLRHGLNWFADTLRSYLTETAIFFTTQDVNVRMEKADDIDEMARAHLDYVVKLQERALLSKDLKPIHKAIIEILDLGVKFSETVSGGAQSKEKSTSRKTRSLWQRDTTVMAVSTELSESNSDGDDDENRSPVIPKADIQPSRAATLGGIERDFSRLLSFVTAGLRSVGRVGAEPMWEQLADRLDWKNRKFRP
ncbi:hypothetical protein ACEQ8H_007356 [Pleosporales sp. CAS-2024a]